MKVGDLVRLRPDLRREGEENQLWLVLWTKMGGGVGGQRIHYRQTLKVLNLTTKYLAEGITPEAFEVVSESR
jgi:hypothetical protein